MLGVGCSDGFHGALMRGFSHVGTKLSTIANLQCVTIIPNQLGSRRSANHPTDHDWGSTARNDFFWNLCWGWFIMRYHEISLKISPFYDPHVPLISINPCSPIHILLLSHDHWVCHIISTIGFIVAMSYYLPVLGYPLVIWQFAIEHGPVEIVDLPS